MSELLKADKQSVVQQLQVVCEQKVGLHITRTILPIHQ